MKVRLIEYKCIVNDEGQPFGHAEKAIEDALMICDRLGLNAEVAASSNFKAASLKLPNSLNVNDYTYRSISKIMQNLRIATKVNKGEEVLFWFVNVDWYLFLFLSQHKFVQKKMATVYKDRFDQINGFRGKRFFVGDILYALLEKGVKQIDLYLETFFAPNRKPNAVYLPDYIYTSLYEEHHVREKIERVICPGTINTQKDVEGLVEVFKQINYPLLIVGQFADKTLYDKLLESKGDNITIDNHRLEYDEYYRLIAESTYCITPYNMNRYTSATSGVIREAIYLGSTVIAPRALLDNMGMKGIGYEKLDDLIGMFGQGKINIDTENDLSMYEEENVVNNIRSAIFALL